MTHPKDPQEFFDIEPERRASRIAAAKEREARYAALQANLEKEQAESRRLLGEAIDEARGNVAASRRFRLVSALALIIALIIALGLLFMRACGGTA